MTSEREQTTIALRLEGLGNEALAALCGREHDTLRRIEARFDVRITGAVGDWRICGAQAEAAAGALRAMAGRVRDGGVLPPDEVEQIMHTAGDATEEGEADDDGPLIEAGRRQVRGKSPNQRRYLQAMAGQILTLAVGPAGTGKTWLAVACAVRDLLTERVDRIILTRPAIEAGERLGFLPGDMQQKVDPYLRPLFDALGEMLGGERMARLQSEGRIEIAPLAYMRGRTLNDAFIILDEAQNTTRTQMKMFLTRLGFGARMVVTGDISQIDLPHPEESGLLHAIQLLGGIEGVAVCRMEQRDVVRHRLVAEIIAAYERADG
ncbi:MAG: PhoH family protein [Zetaproteobacteria bacterium]|nr:MAG: PhoH family protein [Zetaproteobacteria bacterium]